MTSKVAASSTGHNVPMKACIPVPRSVCAKLNAPPESNALEKPDRQELKTTSSAPIGRLLRCRIVNADLYRWMLDSMGDLKLKVLCAVRGKMRADRPDFASSTNEVRSCSSAKIGHWSRALEMS